MLWVRQLNYVKLKSESVVWGCYYSESLSIVTLVAPLSLWFFSCFTNHISNTCCKCWKIWFANTLVRANKHTQNHAAHDLMTWSFNPNILLNNLLLLSVLVFDKRQKTQYYNSVLPTACKLCNWFAMKYPLVVHSILSNRAAFFQTNNKFSSDADAAP